LVPENFPEGADGREGSLIFTKEFLSSLNIFDVTDDSGLSVSGQAVQEPVLPFDLLKDN
jgi:hypothetical protein